MSTPLQKRFYRLKRDVMDHGTAQDCSAMAYAMAADVTFDEAKKLSVMYPGGADPKATLENWRKFHKITFCGTLDNLTPSEFIETHKTGTWLVQARMPAVVGGDGHIFTVRDGKAWQDPLTDLLLEAFGGCNAYWEFKK